MRKLIKALAALSLLMALQIPAHAGQWTKDNLTALFTEVLPNAPLQFHNLAEMPTSSDQAEQRKQAILADQFKKMNPGETAWGLSTPELAGTIIIGGTPDNIHTINFLFTAVNIKPADLPASLSKHAQLFAKLFPDWPEAAIWPNDALHRAWSISIAQINAKGNPEEMPAPAEHLIGTRQGNIDITTMGLVSKFAIFRLTKRPACSLDPLDENVFGRWLC